MDESVENMRNECIYESIAECAKKSSGGTSNRPKCLQPQNAPGPSGACYGLALPISTATAKRAMKNSADKFCDTMNSVCTKFGTLSQKLRRSTRRRVPLINSPGTPLGKSRTELGRTPTKMYSPFSIETPRGKENSSARRSLNRESFKKITPPKSRGMPPRRVAFMEDFVHLRTSPRLNHDMQEAQIGIYEFHHTADRILKSLRR